MVFLNSATIGPLCSAVNVLRTSRYRLWYNVGTIFHKAGWSGFLLQWSIWFYFRLVEIKPPVERAADNASHVFWNLNLTLVRAIQFYFETVMGPTLYTGSKHRDFVGINRIFWHYKLYYKTVIAPADRKHCVCLKQEMTSLPIGFSVKQIKCFGRNCPSLLFLCYYTVNPAWPL